MVSVKGGHALPKPAKPEPNRLKQDTRERLAGMLSCYDRGHHHRHAAEPPLAAECLAERLRKGHVRCGSALLHDLVNIAIDLAQPHGTVGRPFAFGGINRPRQNPGTMSF